jgi:hypothetical protein
LARNVSKDIARYNAVDLSEDVSSRFDFERSQISGLTAYTSFRIGPRGCRLEGKFDLTSGTLISPTDFWWPCVMQLVHGEVFRSPQRVMLLSAFTGSGAQLVCIAAVTLGKHLPFLFQISITRSTSSPDPLQSLRYLDSFRPPTEEDSRLCS